MTFDSYGNRTENGIINHFADYLTEQNHNEWNYCGLTVEIDPTVDYTDQNVLVHLSDVEEGFNNKIIVD